MELKGTHDSVWRKKTKYYILVPKWRKQAPNFSVISLKQIELVLKSYSTLPTQDKSDLVLGLFSITQNSPATVLFKNQP